MKLEKILEQVLNMIFFFFGKKLTGFRTVIVNTITAVLGFVAVFMNEAAYDWLCSINLALFCDFENSKIYGTIMIVIGLLNNVLRYFTEKSITAKYSTYPGIQPLTAKKSKLRTIMILSGIALILLIVKLIF